MTNRISLPRTLFLVLALALLVGLALVSPRSTSAGSTYLVTKTADTADGSCDANDCSLREAVIAANAAPGTVNLPEGTYNLTIPDPQFVEDNDGISGDLDIIGAVDINGFGADTTIIDAGGQTRVFHVRAPAMSTISGVTIRNGLAGIYVAGGSLTLNDSTVSGNTTAQSGSGAGIFNQATLIVNNSTFTDNVAQGYGGGIYNFSIGTSTITNSTISGNTSKFGGGGVFNGTPGTTTLVNVTLNDNTATDIANSGGNIRKDGTGGTVSLKNTIVADSPSGNCYGTITSNGNNLDTGTTCGLAGGGDKSSADAGLVALALNAPGKTATHALLPSSDAINAGGNCPPPATDQRGVTRPLGGACDMGAYEADPRGDADCNGKVEGPDLLDVLADVGDVGSPEACHSNGDVNGDQQITVADALLIAQYWAGVITTFPSGN